MFDQSYACVGAHASIHLGDVFWASGAPVTRAVGGVFTSTRPTQTPPIAHNTRRAPSRRRSSQPNTKILMAASMASATRSPGLAPRVLTRASSKRSAAVVRSAAPAPDALGAAMVEAAAKLGPAHQAQVAAAVADVAQAPSAERRDFLKKALIGVRPRLTPLPLSPARSDSDPRGTDRGGSLISPG